MMKVLNMVFLWVFHPGAIADPAQNLWAGTDWDDDGKILVFTKISPGESPAPGVDSPGLTPGVIVAIVIVSVVVFGLLVVIAMWFRKRQQNSDNNMFSSSAVSSLSSLTSDAGDGDYHLQYDKL